VLIIIFIGAYFIWPYTPGFTSVADIFARLQNDRLAGLISLDLAVPVMLPLLTLQMLALYAVLKQVNESYALIVWSLG
jgi:Na+/proline symporter